MYIWMYIGTVLPSRSPLAPEDPPTRMRVAFNQAPNAEDFVNTLLRSTRRRAKLENQKFGIASMLSSARLRAHCDLSVERSICLSLLHCVQTGLAANMMRLGYGKIRNDMFCIFLTRFVATPPSACHATTA